MTLWTTSQIGRTTNRDSWQRKTLIKTSPWSMYPKSCQCHYDNDTLYVCQPLTTETIIAGRYNTLYIYLYIRLHCWMWTFMFYYKHSSCNLPWMCSKFNVLYVFLNAEESVWPGFFFTLWKHLYLTNKRNIYGRPFSVFNVVI